MPQVGAEESNVAFVASGVLHNFFHRRTSFADYQSISTASVQVAHSVSRIVGELILHVWLGMDVFTEAYHEPEFASNILARYILSETFEVVLSSSLRVANSCLLYKPSSLSNEYLVWEISYVNCLDPV